MGQTSSKKGAHRESRDGSSQQSETSHQDENRLASSSTGATSASMNRSGSQSRAVEAPKRPTNQAINDTAPSNDSALADTLSGGVGGMSIKSNEEPTKPASLSNEAPSSLRPRSLNNDDQRPTTPENQGRHSPPIPTLSPDSAIRSTPVAAANAPIVPNMPTTQTILANPGGGSRLVSGNNGSPNDTLNLEDMIQRLLDAGYAGKVTKSVCLKNAEIVAICNAAREVFLTQPTLVELSPSVKIVGDVHGQYTDLIRLFEMCGFPPSANYLFLGDYVDRGKQSLETVLLLMCYKIKYPENFFLLRGNHECANVTRVYGFYDECKRRCNIKIWKSFIDAFNCLPIAAIVAGKIFCVHGGLSPSLADMDEIRRIARPTDVPDYGLLNDLLWSDPSDTAVEWEDNERGVSYCFGKNVIYDFLQRYDFDLVCRAHMVVEDGYEFFNDRTLVTVFSAPNYCGEFNNWGAVMGVSEELLCSFELLKPLDGAALRKEMTRNRKKLGQSTHSSPPASQVAQTY